MFSDIYFPLLSYKPRARSLPGHYRLSHQRSRRIPLSMYSSPQTSSRYFYPIHSYYSPSQSSLNSSYHQHIEPSAFEYIYASRIYNKKNFDVLARNAFYNTNNLIAANENKENCAYINQNLMCDDKSVNNSSRWHNIDCEHIYYDPEIVPIQQFAPNKTGVYTIEEENFGEI